MVTGINKASIEKAISKYAEILDMCEKAIPGLITEKPKNVWDAKGKRQGFIRILQRSRELEGEALNSWALAVELLCEV